MHVDFSHHAYSIIGDADSIRVELFPTIEKLLGVSLSGNPDFYHIQVPVFGIDESRSVKSAHAMRSVRRIFVLEASSFTHEAQNALLKILEEPQMGTHFFLIIPSAEVLISTLRSRLVMIIGPKKTGVSNDAKNFLNMSIGARVKFVDKLALNLADEKATKQDVVVFLDEVEVLLSKNMDSETRGLEAVIRARDYVRDRSPSVKQLLEYVALSIA